jgi:hypothetical protein
MLTLLAAGLGDGQSFSGTDNRGVIVHKDGSDAT